jgi:hypothetical protein
VNFDMRAVLWETAWPAHPNKGAFTQHELFVVWACDIAMQDRNISILVHGERQFTWIPTRLAIEKSSERRKGFIDHDKRAQSEFCKFVVECFRHERAQAGDSGWVKVLPRPITAAAHDLPGTVTAAPAVQAEGRARKEQDGGSVIDDVVVAEASDSGESDVEEGEKESDDSGQRASEGEHEEESSGDEALDGGRDV